MGSRGLWWLLGAVVIAACTSESDDSPCEIVRVPRCASCGPGEVLGGIGLDDRNTPYARLPDDRTVVLSCGRVVYFDSSYAVSREVKTDIPAESKIIAAGSGDETFVLDIEHPSNLDFSEDPPVYAVRALAADGKTRWRVELGPIAEDLKILATPAGVIVHGDSFYPRLFDRDGVEWPAPTMIGTPDGLGGMIVVTYGVTGDTAEATLTSIDATNHALWSRTWRTTNEAPPGAFGPIGVTVRPDPSGDIVVTGRYAGPSLDLGDATLTAPASWFVARLAANGSTRWATAIPEVLGDGITAAVLTLDRVVVGNGLNLETVTADGVFDRQRFGDRTADGVPERFRSLIARSGGQIAVSLFVSSDIDLPNELPLGSTILSSGYYGRTYVLDLAY